MNFNAKDVLLEMRQDIKTLLSFQAVTEERLKSGATHFIKIDEKIDELEKRKFPNSKTVYSLISVGFIVLAIIISIK